MEATELRRALRVLAHVFEQGEFTHEAGSPNHWLRLSVRAHAARAMEHLDRHLVGAGSGDEHLSHAAARLVLALELKLREAEARQRLVDRSESRRAR